MDQDPYPKPTDVEELRKRIHVMQFIKIANSVIESEGIERSKNYLEIPGEYKGVVLRDPRREDFIMRLDVGLVEGGIEGNAEGAQFLPENFSYPRYIISIFSYDIDELVRTPYGNQRGKVVDPEGQLWFFNNLYLFDKHGQSKNLVKVTRGFDKKSEEDDYLEKMHGVTPEMAERIKVAFVPKQSDTQLVDLDGQDFEKLGHFFDEIKRGNIRPEFTEKKP